MTLSTKEQANKDLVLQEMWGRGRPGFAERKHVVEDLNPVYVRREIDRLEAKRHFLPWILIVGGALVALANCAVILFEDGFRWDVASSMGMMLLMLAIGTHGARSLSDARKRLFAFRLLDAVSHEASAAPTDRHAVSA